MSRDQLQPEYGQQLSKSQATDLVRQACSQVARSQGGTELTKNHGPSETALPEGSASKDIADASRNADGSGMGRSSGEWQMRDDQDYEYDMD